MAEFRMFGGTVERVLVRAVTRYDERQSRSRYYNHYALAQYLRRVDDICADIKAGAPVRAAIVAGMTGSLLNVCLKAVGETPATRDEMAGLGKYIYQPIAR